MRMCRHPFVVSVMALGFGTLNPNSTLACSEDLRPPSVPIMVGGAFAGHNCTANALSQATVRPMKAGSYLAVRNAPSIKSVKLDRLTPGYPVIICTGLTNQQWVGVLYYEPGKEDTSPYGAHDCGLADMNSKRPVAYRGPCRSGWVARRYLMLSAG